MKKEKLLREYVNHLINLPEKKRINVAGSECEVEIADNDALRSKGLMNRESLSDGSGMLFLYPKPSRLSFWMKNTFIPLDIAFIDYEGVIVGISSLTPFNESPVSSPTPSCVAALEVPAGWFSRNGIKVGDKVS